MIGRRALGKSPRHTNMAAYVFPTEPWWQQSTQKDPLLYTCPGTAEEAATLRVYRLVTGALETLWVEHRDAALPLITSWLGSFDDKIAVNVLAEIPTDEAFEALLTTSTRNSIDGLVKMADRFPERALRLGLPQLANDSSLEDLVHGWVIKHHEVATALSPTLSEADRARVVRLLAGRTPRAEPCDLSTLPPLFADPPWKAFPGAFAASLASRSFALRSLAFPARCASRPGRSVARRGTHHVSSLSRMGRNFRLAAVSGPDTRRR